MNSSIFILKPLILKTFTKDGLNDDELGVYCNTLSYFNIDIEDFNNYLENVVFNLKDDPIELIEEKIKTFKIP